MLHPKYYLLLLLNILHPQGLMQIYKMTHADLWAIDTLASISAADLTVCEQAVIPSLFLLLSLSPPSCPGPTRLVHRLLSVPISPATYSNTRVRLQPGQAYLISAPPGLVFNHRGISQQHRPNTTFSSQLGWAEASQEEKSGWYWIELLWLTCLY